MANTTRIQYFLERLDDPRNAYAKNLMPKWFDDSISYANRMLKNPDYASRGLGVEYLRVLYVCNHMCPNLVHFKSKPLSPAPSYVRRDPEAMREYQRQMFEYEYENTQATLSDKDGKITQDGIHYTIDEFELIKRYVEAMRTT